MTLQFRYEGDPKQLETALQQDGRKIAQAATAAFRELGDIIKKNGRDNIAAAGFSKKWQNALRVTVYPQQASKVSISPAIYVTHNIQYAEIFEKGGTISGSGLLWLPLKNIAGQYSGVPGAKGNFRLTPRLISRQLGRQVLFPIKGRRLLAFKMYVPKAQADAPVTSVDLGMLREAVRRKANNRRKPKPGMVLKTVPIFHGVSAVTIRKRFNLYAGFKRDGALFPALYLKNFKG